MLQVKYYALLVRELGPSIANRSGLLWLDQRSHIEGRKRCHAIVTAGFAKDVDEVNQ